LEHEILRESFCDPFDSLMEDLCRHAVQFRKISVQHDTVPPNGENPPGDIFSPKWWF